MGVFLKKNKKQKPASTIVIKYEIVGFYADRMRRGIPGRHRFADRNRCNTKRAAQKRGYELGSCKKIFLWYAKK